MSIKDLGQYRQGRLDSQVIKTWNKSYKQMVLNHIVLKQSSSDSVINKEHLKKVQENSEVAEIVADTVIGWLNSHVGRCFIRDAFGIEVPRHDPASTE